MNKEPGFANSSAEKEEDNKQEGMDEYMMAAQNEADRRQAAMEAQKARKKELEEMANREHDSAYYDAGGGEIREQRGKTSKIDAQIDEARRGLAETRDAYNELSTEEDRAKYAEQLKKEAESAARRAKYYEKGLQMANPATISRLEELAGLLYSTDDNSAREAIQGEIDKYTEGIIAVGKAELEGNNSVANGVEQPDVEALQEDGESLKDEENEPAKMGSEIDQYGISLEENLHPEASRQISTRELVHVEKLLDRLARHDQQNPPFNSNNKARKERERIVEELDRYGYNGGQGSSTFAEMQNGISNDYQRDEIKASLGDRREIECGMLNWLLNNDDKKVAKAARRQLKRSGFKKIPKQFDFTDDTYTSYEISTMWNVAQAAIAASGE